MDSLPIPVAPTCLSCLDMCMCVCVYSLSDPHPPLQNYALLHLKVWSLLFPRQFLSSL